MMGDGGWMMDEGRGKMDERVMGEGRWARDEGRGERMKGRAFGRLRSASL